MTHLIATFFYVGHLRPAPGTWGSLAALPFGWALITLGGWPVLVAATIAAYFIGLWATQRETAGKDNHDPSEIVIDEVAGQWVALFPVAFGAQMMGVDALRLWPGWIAAFVLFRLFDITKPWLVGVVDQRDDATGVMLDDIVAGIFAAVGVVIFASLYHWVLM